MPFVEVWIDEEACDGSCESGKSLERLEATVEEAVRHLRHGDPEAALHALTNDPEILIKSPSKIAAAYMQWKAGRLPGFTNSQK